MNNKGFTLVELLATIVILGIVMSIASYGVINAINTSKEKSEKVFVDKLEVAIKSYLSTNSGDLKYKETFLKRFEKCKIIKDDGTCNTNDEATFDKNADPKDKISGTKCDTNYKNINENSRSRKCLTLTKVSTKQNASKKPIEMPLKEIINSGYSSLTEKDIVNPKTKENCFNGDNPKITFYRDEDYVYYYYLNLSTSNCHIAEENQIVTNIPKNACEVIKTGGYNTTTGKCEKIA